MTNVGYIVDLSAALSFSEDDNNTSSWIMGAPKGEFQHPAYGKLNFDDAKLNAFAESVNNKARSIDLDIDYDHKTLTTEAAGWVKKAEVREDGLWLFVEWTRKAWGLIKDKAFRYFSPEYRDEWKDPSTGIVHKNVLCGGGITNRPFLNKIAAINLNEYMEVPVMNEEQFKSLVTLLGLGEDATVEDVLAKIQELNGNKQEPETPDANKETENGGAPVMNTASTLSENDDEQMKALKELLNGQGALLSEMKVQLKEATIDKKLNEFKVKLGPDKVLSPVAEKKLTEALKTSEDADTVLAFADALLGGIVKLDEDGHTKHAFNSSAIELFDKEIDRVMTSENVDYATAVITVSNLNPKLAEDYREAIAL